MNKNTCVKRYILYFLSNIIQMSNDYDRLLREYNVAPGVLSAEQMKMLQEGGIRLDDSDQGEDYYNPQERVTQPKYPRMRPAFEN